MQKFARAIIKNKDKFLLIKEYKSENYNIWNFPGGKPDGDETLEQACKREVFEETNLVIENLTLFHKGYYSYEISGDWEGFYYLCHAKNPAEIKIKEPTKCDGYCWLKANEIKNIIPLGIHLDTIEKLEK